VPGRRLDLGLAHPDSVVQEAEHRPEAKQAKIILADEPVSSLAGSRA
jgi:hypothetical protein